LVRAITHFVEQWRDDQQGKTEEHGENPVPMPPRVPLEVMQDWALISPVSCSLSSVAVELLGSGSDRFSPGEGASGGHESRAVRCVTVKKQDRKFVLQFEIFCPYLSDHSLLILRVHLLQIQIYCSKKMDFMSFKHEAKDSSSSLCVQISSEAHPASYPGVTVFFPGSKARLERDSDYSPPLVPTSRMSRSYSSSPP
jgi:hypothetical protein